MNCSEDVSELAGEVLLDRGKLVIRHWGISPRVGYLDVISAGLPRTSLGIGHVLWELRLEIAASAAVLKIRGQS